MNNHQDVINRLSMDLPFSREEMIVIINILHKLITERHFMDIEEIFSSQVHMPVNNYITLLRSTYSYRGLIKNWNTLLQSAIIDIEKAGLNKTDILIGLI